MQESGYDQYAVNFQCGIDEKRELHCVNVDFGIAQINYLTMKSYKFDQDRLLDDLPYAVNAGAKVLAWFHRKYAKLEPNTWYCRYNVGTRPLKRVRKACFKYLKDVSRWL